MSNIKLVHSGGNSVSLTTPTSNPASNITFKLPQSDGTAGQVLQTDGNGNLTFVNKPTGITEADMFRLTVDLSLTQNATTDITTNWERPDGSNDGFGVLGSGMSVSGATWTFPSTGFYLVRLNGAVYGNGSTATTRFQIWATEDNSTYGMQSQQHTSAQNGYFGSANVEALIDVTSTTNVKVKFRVTAEGPNQIIASNSAHSLTYVTFIRLGDT